MSESRRKEPEGAGVLGAVVGAAGAVVGGTLGAVVKPAATARAVTDAVSGAETKVKAGAAASGSTSAVAILLLWAVSKVSWVSDMDASVKGALAVLITGGLATVMTFAAGWRARHTHRPELHVTVEVEQ